MHTYNPRFVPHNHDRVIAAIQELRKQLGMSASNKPIKSVPGLNYEILHFSNFVAAAVST